MVGGYLETLANEPIPRRPGGSFSKRPRYAEAMTGRRWAVSWWAPTAAQASAHLFLARHADPADKQESDDIEQVNTPVGLCRRGPKGALRRADWRHQFRYGGRAGSTLIIAAIRAK